MKLVNGHTLTERPVLDEVQIAAARHLLVHLQLYEYGFFFLRHHFTVLLLTMSVFFFCSGPVIKVYLWDNVATEFCRKFKSCETTPTVLLITTVNTKRLGGFHLRLYYCLLTFIHVQFEFFKCVFRNITGTLALTSMSSSRVFMDYDVQPTIDYFAWWVFMYFIFTLSLNQVTCPWTLPNH